MTDGRVSNGALGVETIQLDLPPLVAALSRRLHDRGLPVTPARSADFARALALVRPITRRRLYWTARSVRLGPCTGGRFRRGLLLDLRRSTGRGLRARRRTQRRLVAERAAAIRACATGRPADSSAILRSSTDGDRDEDGDTPEVEVPVAMATDEELLGRKRFDALEPHELAAAIPADDPPGARDAAPPHAALREGASRGACRSSADVAPKPSHRRRSDASRTSPSPCRPS